MENNLDNAKKYLVETNFEFFTQSEQNVIGKTMVAYFNFLKSQEKKKDKWIEIKSKEELPTIEGSYFVAGNNNFPRVDIFTGRISNGFGIFSHYQKIEKPDFPQSLSKAE